MCQWNTKPNKGDVERDGETRSENTVNLVGTEDRNERMKRGKTCWAVGPLLD